VQSRHEPEVAVVSTSVDLEDVASKMADTLLEIG
jgi:hypothetical protein